MSNLIASDSKVIGESYSGYGQNNLITISTGRLYAGHIQDSTGYLEIHYSDDGGSTWTLDYTGSVTIDSNAFSLCKSDLDDVYVCYWLGASSTSRTVNVLKRDHVALTWSSVKSLAITEFNSGELMGAMCHFNRLYTRLHVVMAYHNSGNYIGVYGIYSDDRGTTWSGITTIYQPYNTGVSQNSYLWGVDSSPLTGQLYILNANSADTQWNVLQCNYDYSSPTRPIYDSVNNSTGYLGGAIVVDSSGNYWFTINYIWAGPSYKAGVWKNTSQSLNLSPGSDLYFHGNFSIAADGQDNIYFFYVKRADNKCYWNKYTKTSASWGTEAALTSGDGLRLLCEQHSKPSSTKINYVFYTNS